ncbi:protein of unknown function [Tenacibaculum sp. 190524A02b]|uniref:hypothetical protein n=1 Tax=Tenacibaculum vairaonense TaxID=3137860 RepID=UPI0032B2DBFF
MKESQKEQLINGLFDFLKVQSPEMEVNFSFIHLIESIDNPEFNIYDEMLLKFNSENGTITSVHLLNRYINSLEKGNNREKCLKLLKSISNNTNYNEYVREDAFDCYEYQMKSY